MSVIRTVVTDAQHALMQALEIPGTEARLEARLLLQSVMQVDRAWLISHEHDALQASIHAEFQALMRRRLDGEPIAHILGKREFYGLDLTVTADTLIPRPDTETLVEAALEKIPGNSACHILDLGTGTGAIALAIASQRPHAIVIATDRSPAALDIAASNARRLNLGNVHCLHGDWFSTLGQQSFALIVSNPPYIAAQDPHLSQGDLRFEPLSALASGPDGLDDIRRIIIGAPRHLDRGGRLMLEHGYDQADKVASLLMEQGFGEVAQHRDLAGIVRVTAGRIDAA